MKRLSILIVFVCTLQNVKAQDDLLKVNMIKGVTEDFLWEYPSYSKAKEITTAIKLKFDTLGYPASLNISEFAYAVTLDLRRLTNDEHITIYPPLADSLNYIEPTKNLRKHPYYYLRLREPKPISKLHIRKYKTYSLQKKYDDFSYGEISILPGNIGYVEIFGFDGISRKRKRKNNERIAFKNVMAFLKNTHSIIIDFRANHGGSIVLSSYFASFFETASDTYYTTLQERFVSDTVPDGTTIVISNDFKYHKIRTEFTQRKDVYLLISNSTFSAGADVAYHFKKSGAATIIGEPCNGSGNAHHGILVRKDYLILVPTAKTIDKQHDSIDFLNYTIVPDVFSSADTSLNYTLKKIRNLNANSFPADTVTQYYKLSKHFTPSEYPDSLIKDLKEYEGNYQKAKITCMDNMLFMEYDHLYQQVLIFLAKDEFKTFGNIKVGFIRDEKKEVTGLEITTLSFLIEVFRKV